MKRLLVIALYLICSFEINAQDTTESRAIRVLVVPFNRFELHTEVKLSEINAINNLTGDQFYEHLKSDLMESFILNGTREISYKIIPDLDWSSIQPIKYKMNNKKGHYEASLDGAPASKLKEVLDKHECDYLLTVNWYRILQEKKTVKKDKVNKIGYYSLHYIDYDVFTREGTIIRRGSRLEFYVNPTAENIKYQGLRLEDLRPIFKQAIDLVSLNVLNKED